MANKSTETTKVKYTKKDAKLLPRLTLFFFDRPRLTAIIWLAIFLFGVASYTFLLKREGFPSINIPVASITGTYIVNDPVKVDAQVTSVISNAALKQPGVSSVSASSYANFFTVFITYKEGTDAQTSANDLKSILASANSLPPQASINYSVPYFGATGGSIQKIDLAVSFYDKTNEQTTEALVAKAKIFADELKAKNIETVADVFVVNPFETAINPLTGQQAVIQKTFDRFGQRQNDQNVFNNSVIIGVTKKDGADILKLDNSVEKAINEIISGNNFSSNGAAISASYAPSIKAQISELQRVLLEGLIAVLLVGSIVIAIRASLITVVSMLTVIAGTLGLLYIIGYTLNVITLFAIILSLALIVDDTIIMVEAIDAQRKKTKDPRKAVDEATHKISRAMIAATSTAALSFLPLAFVSGILGSFIRAVPVTIISALVISLFAALVFIPLFAKYVLLGKKQMGEDGVKELASGIESKIARFIGRPMLWARGHTKRLVFVGLTAVFIGFGFIAAGGYIGQHVVFNIFPQSKDSDNIQVTLTFPAGTDIYKAQQITDVADTKIGQVIGENLVHASYYGTANERSATMSTLLIPYDERKITSQELVKNINAAFTDFTAAQVKASQVDAGPPASPFTVRIVSENREAAYKLANDIAAFLNDKQLTRASGEVAKITTVTVANPGSIAREDGKQSVSVTAEFDGSDTTTLVTLAKSAVEKEFTPERIASYGLDKNAVVFDFGQEDENQNSFKTLALAFPIVLLVIFVLLAIEFRSLLQPLLIFMAIPFSLFGISLGLYLTDNPFSFFAMLGFFALIGLSIKNTILLTDYANQARRAGMGGVDAALAALGERFRPLVATSLTAVVSLIPLAILSPFWQGLAVVLIFGLLSSTFLVVTVFPYYYLGAEYLRVKTHKLIRRKR